MSLAQLLDRRGFDSDASTPLSNAETAPAPNRRVERSFDLAQQKIAALRFDLEEPASERAIQSANSWLSVAYRCSSKLNEWKAPHITSSAQGEVVFEWWKKPRKLTMYFSDGSPEFVKVWGRNIDSEMQNGTITAPSGFTALWLWLRG